MQHRSVWLIAGLTLLACYRDNDPNLPNVEPDYPARGQLPPEMLPDGSEEAAKSPCGRACAHLKDIACPEGVSRNCYRGCVKQASLQRIPITCWTEAKDAAAARACGPQLRCIQR